MVSTSFEVAWAEGVGVGTGVGDELGQLFSTSMEAPFSQR